jgi:hypothetical protein
MNTEPEYPPYNAFDELLWKFFGLSFILGGVLLLAIPVGLVIHGLVLLLWEVL